MELSLAERTTLTRNKKKKIVDYLDTPDYLGIWKTQKLWI